MSRGPIVLTSLEEDLEKIGLGSYVVEKKDASAEPVEDSEDLSEYRIGRRRMAGKGKTAKAVHHHLTASERMRGKRYRKSAAGKKEHKKLNRLHHKSSWQHSKMGKRAVALRATAPSAHEGVELGSVQALLEDVGSILQSLDRASFDKVETMKSFAEMALIADDLFKTFTEWATEMAEDAEFTEEQIEVVVEHAESMKDLADTCAEAASLLKEDAEVDGGDEAVVEVFNECLESVQASAEFYADMTEEDDDEDDDAKKPEDDEPGEEDHDEPDEDDKSAKAPPVPASEKKQRPTKK